MLLYGLIEFSNEVVIFPKEEKCADQYCDEWSERCDDDTEEPP
jgi:hypothetical protein